MEITRKTNWARVYAQLEERGVLKRRGGDYLDQHGEAVANVHMTKLIQGERTAKLVHWACHEWLLRIGLSYTVSADGVTIWSKRSLVAARGATMPEAVADIEIETVALGGRNGQSAG